MSQSVHRTDVAIVGAGPVGLFAIFECGMLGLRCHVVDTLDSVGGQCVALYPDKPIYDIPAWPRIEAAQLIEQLEHQAAPFDPAYHLGQRVERLARTADGGAWRLETSAGVAIEAAAVLIAAGVGAFGPNRPPLAGIEAYEGTGVFYYVKRKEDFRGKRVVIAGGGDSALDWALALADIADSVAVVHRRAKFRGAPKSVARLQALADAGTIELVTPYQLAALGGDGGRLDTVVVRTLDDEERRLPADALLPFFGLSMNLGPILDWGLNLDRHHIAVDPASCATNHPGLYAIGDIATYPGKLKLILCGFSEAAMAAHAAFGICRPDQALHFEYSTNKGIPRPESGAV
jgi:thioredoxin reductase (NADPH)